MQTPNEMRTPNETNTPNEAKTSRQRGTHSHPRPHPTAVGPLAQTQTPLGMDTPKVRRRVRLGVKRHDVRGEERRDRNDKGPYREEHLSSVYCAPLTSRAELSSQPLTASATMIFSVPKHPQTATRTLRPSQSPKVFVITRPAKSNMPPSPCPGCRIFRRIASGLEVERQNRRNEQKRTRRDADDRQREREKERKKERPRELDNKRAGNTRDKAGDGRTKGRGSGSLRADNQRYVHAPLRSEAPEDLTDDSGARRSVSRLPIPLPSTPIPISCSICRLSHLRNCGRDRDRASCKTRGGHQCSAAPTPTQVLA